MTLRRTAATCLLAAFVVLATSSISEVARFQAGRLAQASQPSEVLVTYAYDAGSRAIPGNVSILVSMPGIGQGRSQAVGGIQVSALGIVRSDATEAGGTGALAFGPGADTAASSMPEGDLVNLASDARTAHILSGHEFPGEPGNTVFPPDWSSAQIMHSISDIATDPEIPWQAVAPGRFSATGFVGGLWIRTIIEPAGEGIITGYPLP